jgi:hypothetical protein
MKKIVFLTLSLATVCLVVTALAEGKKHSVQTGSKTEVEELTSRIASLQSKVTALEVRLAKLEKPSTSITWSPALPAIAPSQSGVIVRTPGASSISGAFADPNHPPKIWGEGECNGWKYEVIPVTARLVD